MPNPTPPLFSLLIANYNNGKYLEECIRSILAQTYTHWEVVIVDDASTDESAYIYNQYLKDPRFRIYLNGNNKGCGYTKRRCVELAHGELCGFVDPDDALTQDAVETMVEAHLKHATASLIYSTHFVCNSSLCVQKVAGYVGPIPHNRYSWAQKRPIISHFATFKRNLYRKTAGIEPWLDKAVDKDLYFKLEEVGTVIHLSQSLYYYRHHSTGISLNKNARKAFLTELGVKALIETRWDNKKLVRSLMPHSRMELAGALFLSGGLLLMNKRMHYGFLAMYKSLRYHGLRFIPGAFIIISRGVKASLRNKTSPS